HAAGVLGLYLALDVSSALSAGAVGLALGYAISIRPDAILYAVPIAMVVAYRRSRLRPGRQRLLLVAAAALGLFIGLSPFLAYNWLATGNPFHATQAMEVEEFFSPILRGSSSSGSDHLFHGGTGVQVQGGGLRLAYLPHHVPDIFKFFFRNSYGN